MGRNACLAIGISDAPPLDYLPGAVNGAKAIADWAKMAGYDTRLLVDSEDPVGIDTVASKLEELLPKNTQTDRLLIYFAGHGLARDAAEDLWLLSEWFDSQRAIAVGGLKRRLERYGVKQIAIISDACRSLPADADTADLNPDNVLGRGPYGPNIPLVDMLKASSKYKAAYMIPGESLEDDRCIFTGVLEEALWGHSDGAYDADRRDNVRCVTSDSLAKHLRAEVPAKAEFYKVELRPELIAGFERPDDVYAIEAALAAPPRRAWPEPGPTGAMGPGGASAAPTGKRGWSTTPERMAPPPDDLTFAPATDGMEPLGWNKAVGAERPRMPASIDSKPAARRKRKSPPPETPEEERARIEGEANARKARVGEFLNSYRNEEWPTHYETGSGFSLTGAKAVRGLAGPEAIVERDDDNPEWWRVQGQASFVLQTPLPMLVELDDGRWLGTAAIPRFIQTFTVDEAGAASVIYRKIGEPEASAQAEQAVAKLRAGIFKAGAAYDYALELRHGKHRDPMLGVLASYLYDSQGDVDSIRQIAFFYASLGQPIPFDIAMLARIEAERRGGVIWVQIPAVAKRAPRTDAEAGKSWAYEATDESQGVVAGAFPWMRQGWSLVDDSEGPLMPEGLEEVREHLTSAAFTTLSAEGGKLLAKLVFGVRP